MKNQFTVKSFTNPSGSMAWRVQYSTADLPAPVRAIRFYLPVEICSNGQGVGLFHYCAYLYPQNELSPVGYCAKDCTGHSSKKAAREHYRHYLMDQFVHYGAKLASPSACGVCGQRTMHYTWLDFHFDWEIFPLCAAHLNRDGFARVFVLKDYHLLQVSDAESKGVATFAEQDAPVCIVMPQQKTLVGMATPQPETLPEPQI